MTVSWREPLGLLNESLFFDVRSLEVVLDPYAKLDILTRRNWAQ